VEHLYQRSYRNEENQWAEKALAEFLVKKMLKKGREPIKELDVSLMHFREVSRSCADRPIVLFNLTDMPEVYTFLIPYVEVEPFSIPSTSEGDEILILTQAWNGGGKVLFNDPVLQVLGAVSGGGVESCPDLLVRLSGSAFHRSESSPGFAKLLYDPGGYRILRGVNGIPLEFEVE
jgi:hypothetical protein